MSTTISWTTTGDVSDLLIDHGIIFHVTISGTDGPYDGFFAMWDNGQQVFGPEGTAPVTAGHLDYGFGGFRTDQALPGHHILTGYYLDSDFNPVAATSPCFEFDTGAELNSHYPRDVTAVQAGAELVVQWTPPLLDTLDTNVDDVKVAYYDEAWISDGTFLQNVHTETVPYNAASSTYTFPAYDSTHTYHAIVIPHNETVISFGDGEATLRDYYPVLAGVDTVIASADPPPFWPGFGLDHQLKGHATGFEPRPW